MKCTITAKYEGWVNLQAYAQCYKYLYLVLRYWDLLQNLYAKYRLSEKKL